MRANMPGSMARISRSWETSASMTSCTRARSRSCHLPGHVSRIAAEHTMASSPAALMYRVCAGRARISWIHCQSSPRAASISPESILHASNVASSMIDACSHVMGIAGICRVTASGSAPAGAVIIVIMVVPFVPLWFAGLVVRLPVVLSFVLSLVHRRFSADYGRLCRRMP